MQLYNGSLSNEEKVRIEKRFNVFNNTKFIFGS